MNINTHDLPLSQNLLPEYLYPVKSPYAMRPEYITIHNTANRASAAEEANYVVNGNGGVSYHFAVDESEAIQILPLDRNGWHAGDSGEGMGNRKSIGIEICRSLDAGDPRYPLAEDNAAKLAAGLLFAYGWDIDRLRKHQDWSGKYCPHRMLDNGGWDGFKQRVKNYMLKKDEKHDSQIITPPANTLYRVQVGAYAVLQNAKNTASKLKAEGYATYVVLAGGLYKVQVGAFVVKSNAERTETELKSKGYDTYVTTQAGQPAWTDTGAAIPAPTAASPKSTVAISVGDWVMVRKGSSTYEGITPAEFVYNMKYTVDEISGDRAVLDLPGLCTAFRLADLIKV